jgi:hypothetical protein
MDKTSLKDLKDATPEDIRLAEELEKAEKAQGIPQPAEKEKK